MTLRSNESERQDIERQVIGALKSAIAAHGPIGAGQVGSAAKRVTSQIVALRKERGA